MSRKVYIKAASQISIQKDWLNEPLEYSPGVHHCIDPDWSAYFSPMQARRMGNILKRALAVSTDVMATSGIDNPDAIITGTGFGCIENTGSFLGQMRSEGEELLSPTQFMQSTHNTISSLISIQKHCHGYNCTYSQNEISFESALMDAFLQISAGEADSALVGAHDETSESFHEFLLKSGWMSKDDVDSDGAAAMMLSSSPENAICEISDVKILHGKHPENTPEGHVMKSDDYLKVFGKTFAASGLACVAAAKMISIGQYQEITIVNDAGNDTGIIHLKKSCGSC